MKQGEFGESMAYSRSHEPIFWGLFGFGGMVIAFALPAIAICMIYTGLSGNDSLFRIGYIFEQWWGKAAIFLIIFGISFHCVHRMYFTLHDFLFHPGLVGKIFFYGLATALSVAALVFLVL